MKGMWLAIIAEEMYNFLERDELLPEEQKGCRKQWCSQGGKRGRPTPPPNGLQDCSREKSKSGEKFEGGRCSDRQRVKCQIQLSNCKNMSMINLQVYDNSCGLRHRRKFKARADPIVNDIDCQKIQIVNDIDCQKIQNVLVSG